MQESASVSVQAPAASRPAADLSRRARALAAYVAAVTVLFGRPLFDLVALSLDNELHSHIPLIPLVSAYLLYTERPRRAAALGTSFGWAAVFVAAAAGAVVWTTWWGGSLSRIDTLALMTVAFLSLVAAGGFLFLGFVWMVSAAFPVGFLVFMIPMPDTMAGALEVASMKASADVAAFLLWASGTPFVRDDQVFALPGIVLRVAEECSGIRSSWVLFITSWLASHFFLKSRWRGLAAVLFVIPLGIVRNGFRILVIALMCVYIGPGMIDSVIHRHGGPLFFALSLGPLFLLLWWLRRLER
jgi:exosortase C (VPDSG-CTERM-specific)